MSHNINGHNGDPDLPLPMADFELLHQSITRTRFSISPDTKHDNDSFALAMNFPYLMHSGLALAALHLYSEQPHREELLTRAASHQNAALTLVRPQIITSTPEHSQAVLKFAAITSIFALAEPAYDLGGLGQARDPIDELLNSFHLGRGIKLVIMQRWEAIKGTAAVSLVGTLPDHSALKSTLDDTYSAYPTLRTFISQHCEAEENTSCLAAVERLFYYMAILETYPEENPGPMYVQMWPIDVDLLVLDMLTARHPTALIILAHYAALIRLRSNNWWLCRWPHAILDCVATLLDPTLHHYLEWPRLKVVQLDDAFTSSLTTPLT